MGLTAVTASLCLYYSIRSGFVKATGPGRFIQSGDTVFCRFMSNLYILYKISQSRAVQTIQRAIRRFLQQFEIFSYNIDTQREKQVKLPFGRRAAGAHSQTALNSSG